MEIKIQIKGRIYSISFGRKTKFFASKYWFTVIEEFYGKNYTVDGARMILNWFPKKGR